jgi:hypothetical protein
MKNTALVFLICISLGCNTNRKDTKTISVSNAKVINVPIQESDENFDFVRDVKYVFLDNQILIGKIARIIFFDSKIFVHDELTNFIVAFSSTGEYLFHIDRKGKGPFEYLELTDFTIDQEKRNILIFDGKQHKVLVCSIDNMKFTKEILCDFLPFAFAWESGNLFFYNPLSFVYPGNKKYHYSLIKTTTNLNEKDRYFPIDKVMGAFRSVPNKKGFFYGRELCFMNRFNNTIYGIRNDSVYARYKIEFQNNENFDIALKEAITKGRRGENFYSNCASDIMNFCENENFITFKYIRNNKVYSTVFSKQENRIIFHRYKVPLFSSNLMKQNIPIFAFPEYTSNKNFVSVLQFRHMISLKKNEEMQKALIECINDEKLKHQLLNYNPNDNPVLAFYSFIQ